MDLVEKIPEHLGVFIVLVGVGITGADASSHRVQEELVPVEQVSVKDPGIEHDRNAVSVVGFFQASKILLEEVKVALQR